MRYNRIIFQLDMRYVSLRQILFYDDFFRNKNFRKKIHNKKSLYIIICKKIIFEH